MSAVALISDIHGNAVALDAVLGEITARGVERVACLGDVAAGGPEPEAVVARLREVDCACVLGNTDEWLLGRLLPQPGERDYETLTALIEWGAGAVSGDTRRYLASLPPRRELDIGDDRVRCFHGAPGSATDRILAETRDQELREMVAAYKASIYAGGHTHLQLVRRFGGALVVNAGSVGVPLTRDAPPPAAPPSFAEYAIVATTNGVATAEMRRVAVDSRAARAAARKSGIPYKEQWAAILARRVACANERARATLGASELA